MIACLVAIALLQAPEKPAAPRYTPTADYSQRELLGFRLSLHPDLALHPDETATALEELETQLRNVRRVVPDGPLAELVKTPIWIEWERRPRGACEVHVSAGWLKENGYNPDKLYAMEINNARNFVTWSRREQPWMVLHELAHAYHHRVLGVGHEELRAAFLQAQESKRYEAVKYIRGETKRAYALTNVDEYFAELTEAYFGKNDFYPFTIDELKPHDPVGYETLQRIWGDPVVRK